MLNGSFGLIEEMVTMSGGLYVSCTLLWREVQRTFIQGPITGQGETNNIEDVQ